MPTTIYHFDAVTNEYIGSDVADLDPIENKPIIPAYATLIAIPSSIPTGSVAVFDIKTDTWAIVEDHRGKIYDTATGVESMFDKLGALPAGKVDVAPPDMLSKWDSALNKWVSDLAKHQSSAITKIKTDYQTALDAGVTYNGALFQSDAKSIAMLSETLTAIANGWTLPTGFAWIDAVNTPHPANTVFLKGLSAALANHKAALFARLQAAKAAIAAATTVAAVNKVVF